MAEKLAGLTAKAREIFGQWRSIILLGIAVFVFGGGWLSWTEHHAPPKLSVASAVAQPVSADPPATETSEHTVVEEEPKQELPPLPPEAVPAPAAPPPVATVPPSPPVPLPGTPAWRKYALAVGDTGGRPMIAVMIDDMGLDKRRSHRILELPGPLTISFMSYAEELGRQTDEARAHGHELMMHVPMEPLAEGLDPGPGALRDSLPADELRHRVVDDLNRFSSYVGINNHMGSKFTAYGPGMQIVMEELRRRGLLFIDSLTTDHSVGLEMARRAGVPSAARNVFLDNDADLGAINQQLAKLEEVARKKGSAIAIGHPRDATIAALAAWLPTLEAKGFALVPVTAVVKARLPVTAAR